MEGTNSRNGKINVRDPKEDFKHKIIMTTGKRQDEVIQDTWMAISEAVKTPDRYNLTPGNLFQRGGQPVFLIERGYPPRIEPATRDSLFHLANQCVEWRSRGAVADRIILQPQYVKSSLLTAPPPDLPILNRVATTPFFDRDGNLIVREGYHESIGVWLAKGSLNCVPLVSKVSDELLKNAVSFFLDDLLVDFPFKLQADRANAVGLFVSGIIQEMISGPRMAACIDAPTPGSGKTKLANLYSIFVNGDPAKVIPFDKSDAEIRKKITAALIASEAVLLFDNIDKFLDSPSLAAALSTTKWQDRILGVSSMTNIPNAAQFIVTGNNMLLSGELADRMIWIRLEPDTQFPRQRTGFKHSDLEHWLVMNRDRGINSACIMVKHWIDSGGKYSGPIQGTFESYCRVVGGVLEAAGIEGFLGNRDQFSSGSAPGVQEWAALVTAWLERHGEKEVRAKDLNGICEEMDLFTYLRGETRQVSKLSRKIKSTLRGQVFAGYRVVCQETKNGQSNTFRLEKVS